MRSVKVKLSSISPVLFNKMNMEALTETSKRGNNKESDPDEYKKTVYVDGGQIYFPNTWITGTLRGAAVNHKQPRKRSSFKNLISAATFIPHEKLFTDYVMDNIEHHLTSVVVPSTKGRIPKSRGMLSNWELSFELQYDPELIKFDTLKAILADAGKTVGVGDFRVAKGGSFGRFKVVEFEDQGEVVDESA